MRGEHLLAFFLPALVVLVACGSGESVSGTAIDFAVCSQSTDWVRPSVEEQRAEVWSIPRHAGTDEERLREILDASFFNWHGGNSEMFDSWPLHGLWAAEDVERLGSCGEGFEVFQGRYVDLYLLNYEASAVHLEGSTYEVVAEPTERGFQHVEFANALHGEREQPFLFQVRVVDGEGRELYAHELCAPREGEKGCG